LHIFEVISVKELSGMLISWIFFSPYVIAILRCILRAR